MNVPPAPPKFAELERLSVRDLFAHESQSFTRWLAENIGALSAAIEVPLRLLEAKAVSDSRIADLLARDERDGSLVVIENQLAPTDDAHLGQILTYLAATNAKTAVWVAPRFGASHLSALRWLQTQFGPAVSFYAVEFKPVRTAASAPGVIFNVAQRPSRGQTSKVAAPIRLPIAVGGFASAFWSAHLERLPDETRLSRGVGERCRWRRTKPDGVVIGQLVEERSVSVFLRGRYGVTLGAVTAMLDPLARELERRVGVPLRGRHPTLLAVKSLEIDVTDASNRSTISHWMRAETDRYDGALRELVGVREGRRRALRSPWRSSSSVAGAL